jgi:hypothetical protein
MKRFIYLVTLFFILSLISVKSRADTIEIFRLTYNNMNDIYPSAYEGTIAWQGHDGNDYEIFYWNGAEIKQITENDYDDAQPSLYDGTVAWVGFPDSNYHGDIYYWDGEKIIRLTNNNLVDQNPSLNNGAIAWEGDDNEMHDYEIFYWDGTEIIQITENQTSDMQPSLYNSKIAWRGKGQSGWYDIMYWNGEDTNNISNSDTVDAEPSLYADKIAWVKGGGSDREIYLWENNNILRVTNNEYADEHPSLYNGKIAWRGRDDNYHIFYWDGISIIRITDMVVYSPPSYSGNNVVLHRGGYPNEIYYAKLRAEYFITVTSPNGGEELPAGTPHEITWTSEGDIKNVKIEYSVNNGASWIEIVASTENDGFYSWDVPCDISDESQIRISDLDSDASDTSDDVFSIIDDIAPNIEVSASPDILWPPNHKMVHVTTTVTATDNCDLNPAIGLVSIVMNESDETITYDPNYDLSVNDGQTSGDIQIVDDWNFYLRCVRSGKSNGRTYTITYGAVDASGNETIANAEVLVPHNM